MKTTLALLSLLIVPITSVTAEASHPAIHGMLLFGDHVSYASHLPMPHPPHDYQAVFELAFGDSAQDLNTIAAYQAAKQSGHTLFTLLPEPLDLEQLIAEAGQLGNGKTGHPPRFRATLYDGHFEQEGTSLGSVRVQISKLVYSNLLVPSPKASQAESYLVFGSGSEYYAAHAIELSPEHKAFDSILKVSEPLRIGRPCHLRRCEWPALIPVSSSDLPIRLEGGAPENGSLLGTYSTATSRVLQVLYYNESDLAAH
jgi:hypothetical protein